MTEPDIPGIPDISDISDISETDSDMLRRVESEIVGQHRFIESRLRGSAETSLESFAEAHTPDFRLHGMAGTVLERLEVISSFGGARGAEPALSIPIDAVRLVSVDLSTIAATYHCCHLSLLPPIIANTYVE
ncbi:hypothetical protein [Nocardia paucivorans]|uniref:hypothetical protein n=1 Tax=Nocardia paucivorans TaxID=114259 RepID=UPI0002F55345|nr:hypothetical protein [Nocardia paucivorans]